MDQEFLKIIAAGLGISIESLAEDMAKNRARRARAAAMKDARFDAALERVTEIQETVMVRLEAQGYRPNSRIWVSRKTGNVARTFSKQVWDSAKGRMGACLVTVYPDGTMQKTMEKRISIRDNF